MIRRRTFIAGFGSAAAWPVVVRAQQPATVIEFVAARSADAGAGFTAAFHYGFDGTSEGVSWRGTRSKKNDKDWCSAV